MKRVRNISAVLLGLFLPGLLLGGELSYRSDLLERMGKALGEENLVSLPDGEHTAALTFMNTPVTIIRERGVIEHIGYSFFSTQERLLTGPVVCDFLERYALEADLPVKREKSLDTQLLEDGVIFSQGSLASLKTLCPGGHGILEIHNISHSRYIFKWQDGQMVFPSDLELLTGRNMVETADGFRLKYNHPHSTGRPILLTIRKHGRTESLSSGMGSIIFLLCQRTLSSRVKT